VAAGNWVVYVQGAQSPPPSAGNIMQGCVFSFFLDVKKYKRKCIIINIFVAFHFRMNDVDDDDDDVVIERVWRRKISYCSGNCSVCVPMFLAPFMHVQLSKWFALVLVPQNRKILVEWNFNSFLIVF